MGANLQVIRSCEKLSQKRRVEAVIAADYMAMVLNVEKTLLGLYVQVSIYYVLYSLKVQLLSTMFFCYVVILVVFPVEAQLGQPLTFCTFSPQRLHHSM